MDDYSLVSLIKITPERTVEIDGEKFLVVDKDGFDQLKLLQSKGIYTNNELRYGTSSERR